LRLAALQFKADFSDTPKRDDLTIIAPRVDDPEDLVRPRCGGGQRNAANPAP
jgi:hypothetical protein